MRLILIPWMMLASLTILASSCSDGSKSVEPEPHSDTSSSPSEQEETSSPSSCTPETISTQQFLMAFNACPVGNCGPQDHTVHLAGSDDGLEWTLLTAFSRGHGGSVPDIVRYNGDLFLFHTRGNTDHTWDRLDDCLQVVEQGVVAISGGDEGDRGWVDPSLVVDGDDLVLFYLPGIPGADPAACAPEEDTCERNIHSARANVASFPTFTVVTGDRVNVTIGKPPTELRGFSDPDILPLADGTFLLNISSGENTLVYTGTELDGPFVSPTSDGSLLWASKHQGGVPTAIQEMNNLDVWLYVHGRNSDGAWEIRRAVSNGRTELDAQAFEVVIAASIFGHDKSRNVQGVFSPSIVYWSQ